MTELTPREERLSPAQIQDGAKNADPGGQSSEALFSPGEVIGGQYCVRSQIGSGGTSDIYLCDDLTLHRMVAVKVMRATGVSPEQLTMRFQAEGRAMAKLQHKNIIEVYGLRSDHGVPFLVIEYIPGLSLSKLLEKEMTLRVERALNIAAQICEGLECAHQAGIVHRDLKPSNVMIVNPGALHEDVKILDFGIAKIRESGNNLTQPGDILGTPTYMSPEQAQGKPCDAHSDQYSLGCILYEMLTGKPPFLSDNQLATLMAHVNDKVQWPNNGQLIPPHVVATVERMLSKEPGQRLANMHEVKQALLGRAQLQPARKHLGLIGIFAGLVALTLLTMLYLWLKPPINQESTHSRQDLSDFVTASDLAPHQADLLFKKWCKDHPEARQFNSDQFPSMKHELSNAALVGCTRTVPHLEDLCLRGCIGVNSNGLRNLVGLPLVRLNLIGTDLTNEGIKALLSFDKLEDLNLHDTEVGSTTCQTLAKMESLAVINLGKTHITPDDLQTLARLPNLRGLTLDGCKDITGAISALVPTSIEFLNLKGDMLSAEDVAALAKMRSLKSLILCDTSLTNAQLLQLGDNHNLIYLDIAYCSAIDKKTVLEFAARNNCVINASFARITGTTALTTNPDGTGKGTQFTVTRADHAKPGWQSATHKSMAGNLVENGTFAAGILGSWSELKQGDRNIPGWRIAEGSINLVSTKYWQCADGLTCIELNGSAPATIEQSIDTEPKRRYLCQFFYTGDPSPEKSTVRQFTVAAGNQISQPFTCLYLIGQSPSNMGWREGHFEFVAPAKVTLLQFASQTENHGGVCIDNVVVVPAQGH